MESIFALVEQRERQNSQVTHCVYWRLVKGFGTLKGGNLRWQSARDVRHAGHWSGSVLMQKAFESQCWKHSISVMVCSDTQWKQDQTEFLFQKSKLSRWGVVWNCEERDRQSKKGKNEHTPNATQPCRLLSHLKEKEQNHMYVLLLEFLPPAIALSNRIFSPVLRKIPPLQRPHVTRIALNL